MNYFTVTDTEDWTGLRTGDQITGWKSLGETYGTTTIGSSAATNGGFTNRGTTGLTRKRESTNNGSASSEYSSYSRTVSGSGNGTSPDYPGNNNFFNNTASGSSTIKIISADTFNARSGSSKEESSGGTYGNTYYTRSESTDDWVMVKEDDTRPNGTYFGSFPAGTTPSSTALTFSGPSLGATTYTVTYGYDTNTVVGNNEGCPRVTTTSSKLGTLLVWGTINTSVFHSYIAISDATDESAARTGEEVGVAVMTKNVAQTNHAISPLEDTVIFMQGGLESSNSNLGHALWTYSNNTPVWSVSSTGPFTYFYASTDADSFTISDLRMFSSSVWEIPIVVRVMVSDTDGLTRHKLNGYETTGIASSEGYTQSFDLGAVSESVSGEGTDVTTYFKHSIFVSGYETSGAQLFTTGNATDFWLDEITHSQTHAKWASSVLTTISKHSRVETTYAKLYSSWTITGSGDDTGTSYLGMKSTVLSTVLFVPTTLSSKSYRIGDICDQFSYDYISGNYSAKTVIAESASRVAITSARLTFSTKNREYLNIDNAVWFTVPAHGILGFGGSYTQPDQMVYLTTTQGLHAGNTFADATLYPPSVSKDFQDGRYVTFFPVNEKNPPLLLGIGLLSSSLMSVPSSVVTDLSVAATWTSTYLDNGVTSTSSKSATHTLGVTTPIIGEFFASEQLVFNSLDRNIGVNGPHATIGGWGAGNNRMDAAATVWLAGGFVSWTELYASESIGGVNRSTVNSAGTCSFILPSGCAMVFNAEDIIEACWVSDSPSSPHHFLGTEKHIYHSPTTPQ